MNEAFKLAWKNQSSFREIFWSHIKSTAEWQALILLRTDDFIHTVVERPESLKSAIRASAKLQNALRAENRDKYSDIASVNEAFKLLNLTHQVDADMTKAVNLVQDIVAEKEQSARKSQIIMAVLGAILILIGKLLEWRNETAK